MVDRRGVERGLASKRVLGLSWLAGLAIGVVGAKAVAERRRAATAPDSEFTVGRGRRRGPVSPAARKAGYETVDANVRVLVTVMVVSVVMLVGALASVFFVFSRFDRHFEDQDIGLTAEQRAPIPPPLPHLQANPYRDRDAALMEQTQRLTTYGTAGPAGEGAHIPIGNAMRQVIGHPLDASAQADAAGPPSAATAPLPPLPDFEAARRQAKPANTVEGEGRAGAVAPSYDPAGQAGGSK